jgi:hypothetical protein
MPGSRTTRIVDRVQLLFDPDNKKVTKALINSFIDDAQSEMAETTLCIESSATLTVAASSTTEPTGFYKMKLIAMASGQLSQAEEISVTDYDAISRFTFNSIASPTIFYKRWNGTLTFYPTLAAGSYTCYFWKTPSTNVGSTVDPETPARFDPQLEDYTVYHCAPFAGKPDYVALYKKLYDDGLKDAIISQRRTKPGVYQIEFHDV